MFKIGQRYYDILSDHLVIIVAGAQPAGFVTVKYDGVHAQHSWTDVVKIKNLRNVFGY